MKVYIYATSAGVQIEAITRLTTEKAQNASSPKHFSEVKEFAESIMEGLTISINNSRISVGTIISDGIEESLLTKACAELKDAAKRINNFIDDLPTGEQEQPVEDLNEVADDFEIKIDNIFEELKKQLPGHAICLMVHNGEDTAIVGNMKRGFAHMLIVSSMLEKARKEHENEDA